ncbi:MAG: hypothetical protein PHV33_05340 [Elusimicrobiales bacterium]|nr:hypothetical protein [Elusimicrobiales bacterium]
MDSPKNKKDSLFSVVFPQQEPSPAAPPQRPAILAEHVTALEKKIEVMSRDILVEIEKRMANNPQAQLPAIAELSAKLAEIEKRIRELQEKPPDKVSLSNEVEARQNKLYHGIEEFLKYTEEQRQNPERDRQVAAKLDEVCARIDGLERRMMKTPPFVSGKRIIPESQQLNTDEVSAAISKSVENKLDAKIAKFEALLKIPQSNLSGGSDGEQRLFARIDGLFELMDSLSSEVVKQGRNPGISKETIDVINAKILAAVSEAVAAAGSNLKGNSAAVNAMSGKVLAHIDSLSSAQAVLTGKIAELVVAISVVGEPQRREIMALRDGIAQTVRESVVVAAAQLREENFSHFKKVRETLALSATGLAAVSSAANELSRLEGSVLALKNGVRKVLSELLSMDFGGVLGVSRPIIQKNLDTLPLLCAELEKTGEIIAAKRAEMESVVDRLHTENWNAGANGGDEGFKK